MAYCHDEGIKEKFFSYDSRLNRLRYLKRIMILVVSSCLLSALSEILSEIATSTDNSYLLIFSSIFLIATGLFSVIAIISVIMLQIRRLKDFNSSPWWVLLSLVPFVNLIFGLVLLLKEGTKGDNKYGGNPLQISTLEKNANHNEGVSSEKQSLLRMLSYVSLGMVLMGVIIFGIETISEKTDSLKQESIPNTVTVTQDNKSHEPGIFVKLGDKKQGISVPIGAGKTIKIAIVLEINPNNRELILNDRWNESAEEKTWDVLLPIVKSMKNGEFNADTQDHLKTTIKKKMNQAFGKDAVYEVYITSFLIE